MIQPTVGRVLWYYPSARDLTGGNDAPMTVNGHDPLMAQVVAVHNERCVSLAVLDAEARKYARLRVQLLQNDGQDKMLDTDEPHCVWPVQAERKDPAPVQEKSLADRLRELIAIQSSPGTVDQGDYMHGMANGLILALSVVTGEDPKFIKAADFKRRLELVPDHPVQRLAAAVGGTIEHVARLPDGSGAATMSMPLPTDHWLTRPGNNVPPMVWRTGTDDPSRGGMAEEIQAAARYAIRASTMNGAEEDFDPDAMVQNFVIGMLGYWTPDGLSRDADANPAT